MSKTTRSLDKLADENAKKEFAESHRRGLDEQWKVPNGKAEEVPAAMKAEDQASIQAKIAAVVEERTSNMPGTTGMTPKRKDYLKGYAQMLTNQGLRYAANAILELLTALDKAEERAGVFMGDAQLAEFLPTDEAMKVSIQAKIADLVEERTRLAVKEVLERFEVIVKDKLRLEAENKALKEMVDITASALEGISQDVQRCRNEFTAVREKVFSD